MNDKCCYQFQDAVDEYLVRHRSVFDVLTKYQEAAARVNRAYAKAVTECGCVTIEAGRQEIPEGAEFRDLKQYMSNHASGQPCAHCREVIAKEMGRSMFYQTALCNLAGLNIRDVMEQERKNLTTLGVFHLS
ncbi:MAG: hypothetical protein K0Q77_128 [Anaerosporomusa subterranea]|jgi:hypothetical protein|nr:hypothetical protein [Anaerosporomusa subterranea]